MKEITLSELYGKDEDKMGLASTLGITKGEIDDEGRFSVYMKGAPNMFNVHNGVHGGALFTLCFETIAAYNTYTGRDGVGTDGNIRYYRPAGEGELLKATVEERKGGRRMAVYMVVITNEAGKTVAEGTYTIMFV